MYDHYPHTTVAPPPCTYERYGVILCLLCDLALPYCRCGMTPAEDVLAKDGAETGLRQRIAEVVGKRAKQVGR